MSNKNKARRDAQHAPKPQNQPSNASPSNAAAAANNVAPNKVVMIFSEHKYYHDMSVPHFEANKPYELEGEEWIQRWLKRGGKIIEGKLEDHTQPANPSAILEAAKPAEQAPEEKPAEVAAAVQGIDSEPAGEVAEQKAETSKDELDL